MGMVGFTDNYQDRSTQEGYQFEFFCERCGNGYKSEFKASMLGMGGKAAPYLHSMGNGALAAHFHTVGRGVGKEMREKAGLAPVAMSGEGPAEGGSNLSDDALLEMARRRG